MAIQKVRDPVFEGASHDLAALPKPRPHVSLDEVLAGKSQSPIAHFAVADGRHFVTANQDNELQVHQEGVVTPLRLSPPLAIKALALDHEGHLYAHSQGDELFRVDREAWQGSARGPHRWARVELPAGRPLESLRMGADKHLVAGWDKQFHRLDRSDSTSMQWGPLLPLAAVPLLGDTLASAQMRAQFPGGALTASSHVMGQTREGISHKRSFFQGIKAHFHPLESLSHTGKDIQHRVSGRRGLEAVYADDKQLHERLKPLSKSKPVAADLSARLVALSVPGPRQALANQISQALARVEASSQACARLLGD